MSTENQDMNGLSLQDLMVLKQFLEKGFREEGFFFETEKQGLLILHQKLNNIITNVIEIMHNQNNNSK